MVREERNCGIDIFRIMCCVGVLCYHIMDDIPGIFLGGGTQRLYILQHHFVFRDFSFCPDIY